MKLGEGTKLKKVSWREPHLIHSVGQEEVQSLTVSLEAGGPWVVVELLKTTFMQPLDGTVKVWLAEEQE